MDWLDDLIGNLTEDAVSSWDPSDVVAEVATESLPAYFESGVGLADYAAPAGDAISGLINNTNYDVPANSGWIDSLPSLPETSMYSGNDIPTFGTQDLGSYFSANQMNPVTNAPSYMTDSYYTGAPGPSFMDTLDKYGTMLASPGGRLLTGIGGAGISALGAMKQNALLKEAAKKQAKALAARQAAASLYNAPLRLSNPRSAVESPTARRGESAFFTNNRIPSYLAEGGSTGQSIDAYCGGGAMGYVRGGTPGQADKISAQVSDGEYVMDSDVVSALGDGNNEAGAQKLDEMRKAVRTHKRSAPASKIPPKAKSPLEYMKKSKGAK